MDTDRKVAISIKNVSKDFKLPHHNQPSSVKSIFVNPFQSKKTDPLKEGVEKQHALKDISFDIYEGEFFGIVGKNGSGKSTLLKIIAGIYQPNKGKVHYSGKLVPFIELGVGFNPELSGRDNVYLSGALMGFSTKEIDEKYQQIVDFAELERFMDQLLKNYSSGMQVRLAFSVATILGDSDILLIDEVLAVGDADFQRKCFNYFKTLKKLKKTVVFVSHDMTAVREFCDKAVLIDDSRLIEYGGADDIARLYGELFSQSAKEDSVALERDDNDVDVGRDGNGLLKIHHVKVSNTEFTYRAGQIIEFNFLVEAYENDLEFVSGFRVEDSTGWPIFGTNTMIEHINMPKLSKTEKASISWSFPNILSDGNYTITLSLHSRDGIDIYDFWPDALEITVKRPERIPYPVYPEIKVSVNNQ